MPRFSNARAAQLLGGNPDTTEQDGTERANVEAAAENLQAAVEEYMAVDPTAATVAALQATATIMQALDKDQIATIMDTIAGAPKDPKTGKNPNSKDTGKNPENTSPEK